MNALNAETHLYIGFSLTVAAGTPVSDPGVNVALEINTAMTIGLVIHEQIAKTNNS